MTMSDQDQSLHRYELVERLAVGGMAEVFRAKAFGAHGFEKVLAIKRILPDLAADPEFESRFIAEAKLTVALTHANIVQVHDFGRVGGSLYIAMEFVDGPDLATLMKAYAERKQRVPVGAAMHIAMELAKGLDFAHRKGVVHHDVSPSNILLSRAGEVKVADFGIAQAAAESERSMQGARRIMGKWRYMSPEQTRGEKLDARSDLFSAGVVMFELLTGERLFGGDDIESIVTNIRTGAIPKPSSVRRDLPPALDEVMLKVLERERPKRFAQASDLLRSLTEISYQRTLVATSMDVAEVVSEAFPPATTPTPSDQQLQREKSAQLIDDIIASELMARKDGGKTVTRVTAQAEVGAIAASVAVADTMPGLERKTAGHATFVRKVGPDGVTRLELTEGTPTEPPAAVVAGVPRVGEAAASPPRSRAPLVLGVLAILALAGAAIMATRGGGAESAAVAADASGAAKAVVEVSTSPPGALVVIDGETWSEKTPTQVQTTAGEHQLQLRLARYRLHDETISVAAGQRAKYSIGLLPMVTRLEVKTEPAGATVELDDRPIGETPFVDDVPADGQRHLVRIRKPRYADVTEPITLEDGKTVEIGRTLEPTVRYGSIDLSVDPWADVYFEGRKIGQAPVQGLRLPVGTHKLRLLNPPMGKSLEYTVEVVQGSRKTYRVKLE